MPQLRHRLVSRIRATPRYLVVLTLLYLLGTPVAARPEPSSELPALLAATAQPSSAREVADSTLKSVVGSVSQDIWPYAIFISAEIHRQKNGTVTALNEYRQLADWGAENAREHGWGGSALATFALWRWLTLVDHEANEKDARWALVTAKALRDSRFAQGLFASLPRIEADMARRLAGLAWSNNFPEAIPLFIDFLSVAYADDLSEDETEMYEETLDGRYATKDRLELLRGRRFFRLGEFELASKSLDKANRSDDPQVRAEASLYLTKISRLERQGDYCDLLKAAIIDLDTVVENGSPDVVQEALFDRGMAKLNARCTPDEEGGVSDLNALVAHYPDGQLTDNALYQLARYFERTEGVGKSFEYYAQLRELEDDNDYENFARARPAWVLYARNKKGDREKADALFQEIIEKFPDGDLYLTALFWRARIASDAGNKERAQRLFERIIAESPYSYYATRARMHLNLGDDASKQLLPDARTKATLKKAFDSSRIGHLQEAPYKYIERIRFATRSGLYREALTALAWNPELGVQSPLRDRTLEQLDETGLMTRLAVLIALREAAFAAIDSVQGRKAKTETRLRLAGSIGELGGDWPTALELIRADPLTRAAEENNSLYLSTTYPRLFADEIGEAARAFRMPPELLYSIIHYQSSFDHAAVSPSMGFGLFQFIPSTFWDLNEKWNLVDDPSDERSRHIRMQAYLVDPRKSISLGARFLDSKSSNLQDYVDSEMNSAAAGPVPGNAVIGNEDYILFSVMAYHASEKDTKSWIDLWDSLDRIDDIEFIIDTIQYWPTRRTVREIIGSMMLIESSEMFGAAKEDQPIN